MSPEADQEKHPAADARRFELVETVRSGLWDFGTFDRSRFRILQGPANSAARDVLADFLRCPLFPRVLCTTPDPWGAEADHHGPILLSRLSSDAYSTVSGDQIDLWINAVLNDAEFDSPPDPTQSAPIFEWLREVRRRRMHSFALNGRSPHVAQVDWSFTWLLFHEFIAIDPRLSELWVACILYD